MEMRETSGTPLTIVTGEVRLLAVKTCTVCFLFLGAVSGLAWLDGRFLARVFWGAGALALRTGGCLFLCGGGGARGGIHVCGVDECGGNGEGSIDGRHRARR